MLAFLWRWLVGGCWGHKWVTIHETTIVNEAETPTGRMYTLRCEKCGEIVTRTAKPPAVWLD